ncbi:hypothetical protein ACFFX0_26275 [Citricoccus parietis]|uniref:Uncharacterized protein n=1 Tax=Citricoccus parietis TaxID=592307 RepID=A0ABV5G6D7_9MICC
MLWSTMALWLQVTGPSTRPRSARRPEIWAGTWGWCCAATSPASRRRSRECREESAASRSSLR